MSSAHRRTVNPRILLLVLIACIVAACRGVETIDDNALVSDVAVPQLTGTIVIPTPDVDLSPTHTATVVEVEQAVEIRSISAQMGDVAVSRPLFRPIPTVNSANLNRAQNIFAATPVTPQPTADSPHEDSDALVTRGQLNQQIEFSRNEIRNLTFVLGRAARVGTLNCREITKSYGRIVDNAAAYAVPANLTLPYEAHELAVETTVVGLSDMHENCLAFADNESVSIEQFTPEQLIPDAVVAANTALQHIYDAVLWLNADELKTHTLYNEFRQRLVHYGSQLTAADQDCPAISDAYQETISAFSYLSPPGNYRWNAYQHYTQAIDTLQESGQPLVEACDSAAGVSSATRALPPNLMSDAVDGYTAALYEVDMALAVRPQLTPTPTATPVPATMPAATANPDLPPVTARLVRVQPSESTHLYEVVLQISINIGGGPFDVFIGGHKMDPQTNLLIVRLGCDRDFSDRALMTDSKGTVYRSNIVGALRSDACPRYQTEDWATATPHPTLTPKPQPTKYPTNTPLPTFTPWATPTP